MENLNQVVGDNLKRHRADRGLSLDAVARLSGVSKSMLGQIERGEVNPTISTLWRIANGLKVSFTALVHSPEDDHEVVYRKDIEPILEDGGRCRNYPLFSYDAERSFEMYTVELDPSGYVQADGHTPGSQEFITVCAGSVTVRFSDEEHLLECGDSIRFKADEPHSYHNPGQVPASMSMVIHYPRVS